jgi:hypothetical protein
VARTGSPECATTVHPSAGPGGGLPPGAEGRSSSVTESMPNASRTRSSTAVTASSPRNTLPAVVVSSSDSAPARAAWRVRLAAMSTTQLTSRATTTNTPSARTLLVSAMVSWWMGGVK